MNPLELAKILEEKYSRYLTTTFYFKDPQLRESFRSALKEARLAKGPYVEATPVFRRRWTPAELFERLLGRPVDKRFSEALGGSRPLYLHQEQAITRTREGRNVVVATGTGSGKTEAFLFPILLSLMEEQEAGGISPGVRALILYPMNALANDQRDRLGEISERLRQRGSSFSFTFGQYIGDTPEDERDAQHGARERDRSRLPGELVFRSEMRLTPPNILLTNFSMLEYLLIRPYDSPLFDDGNAKHWQYIVLDEAHQYRGARGIEMAMLIRRLKRRLMAGGRKGPFRCIATSATLASDDSRDTVADFASNLFGELFESEDIILGETEAPHDIEARDELDPSQYAALRDSLESADLSPVELFRTLIKDHRSLRLRRALANGPMIVDKLAEEIFPGIGPDLSTDLIATFVDLLVRARDPENNVPLMTARFHVFLRSLEGAFVSYWPKKAIYLDRVSKIGDAAVFELALCRQCGQHYLVGKLLDGKLGEAVRDQGDPDFGASFFRPLDSGSGEVNSSGSPPKETAVRVLCIQCGCMWSKGGPSLCSHGNSILVEQQDPAKTEDQIPKCGACDYRAPDPVRELLYGTDGPHAVIATNLYEHLPPCRRKVLAFADGRQDAAFFAWYLQDSYEKILARNLLLETIKNLSEHTHEGISVRELVMDLKHRLRTREAVSPAAGELDVRRSAWIISYRELLTDEPRISLEGLGLAKWFVRWPAWIGIPQVLREEPWRLTEQEARDLMQLLMDSIREDSAVELRAGEGVSIQWGDLQVQSGQMSVRIGEPKGKRTRSWDGKTGRRARLLEKILLKTSVPQTQVEDEAIHTLRSIWDSLRDSDLSANSTDRLLLSTGDERRLNPDWWRVTSVGPKDALFRCTTCGHIQHFVVRGVCSRPGCNGSVTRADVDELSQNHYRAMYLEQLPGALRVEEHTAQLDREIAREFQSDFKAGKIHVLSCSTTFELGVDLGDLDTIFLRNVPPEAFNYAQRVGRAGRRSGRAGFAVTYCRRRPHDLYYFACPDRMLAGRVRSTPLSISNDKIIARHMSAEILSAFFRANPAKFKNVIDFFGDLSRPQAVNEIRAFVSENTPCLTAMLNSVVPSDMHAPLGLKDSSWPERLTGSESQLSRAQLAISDDYRKVKAFEKQASEKGEYDRAQWAQGRAVQIEREDVLSFLSRKVVIPKYGFPVDVVELDTQRNQKSIESTKVALERDLSLAIAEFAPTSKLVANKKLWTSYALKRVADKEWPRKGYERCARHNYFQQWDPADGPALVTKCCKGISRSEYIVPIFGFTTNADKPKDPKSRTTRVFTTRPYFAGEVNPSPGSFVFPARNAVVEVRRMTPGNLVVLCEGRKGEGFYVCQTCGAGFDVRKHPHDTPYGVPCDGQIGRVSLGHEFVTDVLQLRFLAESEVPVEPLWFAYSLASALVEGAADILEVPPADLSSTIWSAEAGFIPPIILYDNVPGGAGLVARLESESVLKETLKRAYTRVNGDCGCEEDASCYGCIRSYRNQFSHRFLQRGPVKTYLLRILESWGEQTG